LINRYRVRARHIQVYEIEADMELDVPPGFEPTQRQIKEALSQTVLPWRQRIDLCTMKIIDASLLPLAKRESETEADMAALPGGSPPTPDRLKVPPPMVTFPPGRG